MCCLLLEGLHHKMVLSMIMKRNINCILAVYRHLCAIQRNSYKVESRDLVAALKIICINLVNKYKYSYNNDDLLTL